MSVAEFDPVRALSVLLDHEVRFVLIGGLAASLRGSPVITGDVDICYARDERNLVRLAVALQALHARLRGAPADVPFILDDRSLRAGDSFTFATDVGALDILGTPSGTSGYRDLVQAATPILVEGLVVPVASIDDLIRMKLASGRRKDRLHAEWLGALLREAEEQGES